MTGFDIPRTEQFGFALIILSSLAYALVPSLALISYNGGTNAQTLISLRSVFSVAAMLVLLRVLHQPIRIGRKPMVIALASGAAYGGMLYSYFAAVNYLPVNLVIIIFAAYALLVGLIAATVGLECLTAAKLVCPSIALGGLTLAVGTSFDGLDLGGILLAMGAAVAAALATVGSACAMRAAPTVSVLLYVMTGSVLALSLPLAVANDVHLPETAPGWVGLVGVAFCATFGTVAFTAGVAKIGAVRAAMISNLEPVLGIALAVALLGESLSWPQAMGLVLVVGSICGMHRATVVKAAQPA